MEDYFSIGELSRYQNISKQTLIFYDKLGLFQPAYVDPNNGYRYYTARQLDELDTILILKKSGLSLQRIKELLEHYCTWLFDILFELERELDISHYSDNDKRVFGFVSERLLDAWLVTNRIHFQELDIVYLEPQRWLKKGTAFLARKLFPKKQES